MEYNISGKLTLADYINFNRFYYKNMGRIIFIIILLFLIVYLIFNLKESFEDLSNVSLLNIVFEIFLPIIIFTVLFLLFSFLRDKFVSPIIYKKYFYSNKMLSEMQNIKITDTNIIISSTSSNIIITKDNIYKIAFNKNYIYIYMGLNMAYMLKDSFFENNDTFNEVKIFIKDNYW